MIIICIVLVLLLINIIIYYELMKLNNFFRSSQAQKICAWVEGLCDTESIENYNDDKNNSIKYWGLLIANNSNSIIYDIKITIEEIQNDRVINIHRNISLLPPGKFYCKRLYNPSKLPFDLPKRLTNFRELINFNNKDEYRSTRPMIIGKKRVIKLEFRDSNRNLWEKNEFGNLKLIK